MMPKFKVELPDGSTHIIDAPEGATAEMVAKQIAATMPKAARSAPKAGFGDRFLTGLGDPIHGLGQIGARALEVASPVAGGLVGAFSPSAGQGIIDWASQNREDLDAIVKDREKTYEAGRGPEDGFDAARLLGNVVGGLPLGAGGAGARGALALAKEGAVLGGIGAAAQPTTNTDNFALTKLAQTGVGAAAGGIAAPVVGKMLDGATGLTRRVVERLQAREASQGAVPPETAAKLMLQQQMGQERWQALSQEVKDQLTMDATAALRQTGRIDPAALGRRADFAQAGITPTKAWVTGDPVDFTKQGNAAQILPSGEPIIRAEQAANQRMTGMLDEMRPPGAAQGPYGQGSRMAESVQASQNAMDARVNSLYDKLRAFGTDGPQADPVRLMDRLATKAHEGWFEVPGNVVSRLNQMAAGKAPLTPRELQQLYVNANSISQNQPAVAKAIKESVLEEFDALAAGGANVPAQAASVLQRDATAAARQNFQRQEQVRAFADAKAGAVNEERFFDKYILNADVRQFRRFWGDVGSDPNFVTQARAAAVDRLKKAAIGTGDSDKAPFAPARFKEFLNQAGLKEKLRDILPKEDYEKVLLLERLSNHIQAPKGDRTNRSNTSGATITFAQRILRSMGGGSVSSDLLRAAAGVPAGAQAQRAATAQGSDLAQRAALSGLPDDVREAIVRALSAPTGAAASGYFSR